MRVNGLERWLRIAVGRTVERYGAPLTIKLRAAVEPYFRNDGSPENLSE